MTRGLPVLAVSILALAAGQKADACSIDTLSGKKVEQVRELLASRYPDGEGPGAAVVVACDGTVLLSHNSGMANVEWRQPISGTTSFRVGSISKPLTAVAVLQLAERGAVDLDEPVSTYVPLLPDYMRPVTVRQLLSHTSGLPDILLTPSLLPLARDWVSVHQVIDMQAATPPRQAPGLAFDYSNFNYVLLTALLEAVTDTPYPEYMDRTFASLGLTRSRYDARRSILPERAQGYETNAFGALVNSENIDMSHAAAAGALLSSAGDLARWSHLLVTGALLTPETLAEAWSPRALPDGSTPSYGLGFNVSRENGRRVVWHNGLASGFQAAFSIYPDHGLVVVVLSNGFHLPNTTESMDAVADIVLSE